MIKSSFIKIILLLCYITASYAEQVSDDVLFNKIFKKKKVERRLTLPLYESGQELDEVIVIIANQSHIKQIDTNALLHNIKPLVTPSSFKKLQTSLPTPWCTVNDLKQVNIKLNYDYLNLILNLTLPLKIKRALQLDLSTFKPPRWVKDPLEPQAFSHYTNLRYYQTFSNESSYRRNTLDLHAVTNINQYVLAIDGSYHHQNGQNYWQRDEITLTKDFIGPSIRAQLGDLAYSTRGHQVAQEIMGFQLTKEFSIHPYTTFYPNSHYEFTLKENSDVEVYINNHLVRTIAMKRGKHSLHDLPLNQGINDIKLKIKDRTGRIETIEIPAAMSFNLLKPGVHQFSYSLGVTNHPDKNQNRIYETRNPLLNFFHYYGVNSNYTIGQYGQWKENYLLLGSDQVYNTIWGEFSFDTVYSKARQQSGAAATINYKLTLYSEQLHSPFDFSLQFDYKTPYFFIFDQTQKNSHYITASTSIGADILDLFYLRFGMRYIPAYLATEQDYSQLTLTINKHLWRNFNTNIQLSHTTNHTGTIENSIAVYCNLLFPEKQQNLMASYDSISNEQNLIWDYNQAKRSHKWNGRAALRKNSETTTAEASAEYVHDRFSSKLTHLSKHTQHHTTTEERFNFNTAIAYTAGHWTMSHPIYESFALIKFDQDFANYPLYLNSSLHDHEGSSTWFNDLVVSNLQDYRYQNSSISSFELPPGFSLPKEFYSFHALNHSGNFVFVKNLFQAAAFGKIFNQGTAWKLQSGEFHHRQSNQRLSFFTNRKGKFFVEGLQPGHYDIFSNELEMKIGEFELTKNQRGIINLGTINISNGKRKAP